MKSLSISAAALAASALALAAPVRAEGQALARAGEVKGSPTSSIAICAPAARGSRRRSGL